MPGDPGYHALILVYSQAVQGMCSGMQILFPVIPLSGVLVLIVLLQAAAAVKALFVQPCLPLRQFGVLFLFFNVYQDLWL